MGSKMQVSLAGNAATAAVTLAAAVTVMKL